MARNAETAPIAKVTRPDQTPGPAKSINDIPSMDSGHTQPNFPGYDHGSNGGIPVAKSTNAITPGTRQGDLLSIPGATIGEKGGNN